MGIAAQFRRLCLVENRRLLMVISVAIIIAALLQCFALPYWKRWSLSTADEGSLVVLISNATFSNNLRPRPVNVSNSMVNDTYPSDLDEEVGDGNETKETSTDNLSPAKSEHGELTLNIGAMLGKSLIMGYDASTGDDSIQATALEIGHGNVLQAEKVDDKEAAAGLTFGGVQIRAGIVPVVLPGISAKNGGKMDTESSTSNAFFPANETSADNVRGIAEIQPQISVSITQKKNSPQDSISTLKRGDTQPMSISQMNSLLLHNLVSSHYVRTKWYSVRDRELLSAKLKIENAPILRSPPGLYASAFRNVSIFKRSYELMERMLRIYIYKEGEKPVFHQSKMIGIYASEGWFIKLLEGNKKFIVRDPRKAHLFYLPFSSLMLRTTLFGQNLQSQRDLEGYLKNYVDLVARKYSFWNRTGGADHFLVGCHDWASRITRQYMRNCIRVLCNANVAKGFEIGKDTTLPVTYIRSAENPLKDLGGRPPSERHILAFFAGGMHGYLRPVLLQFWQNKESDMKIFGPMHRDIEGKSLYREYMKGSKYCICARGYEVHTPRVVEAIFYERKICQI